MSKSLKATLSIFITYTFWGIQPLYWRMFTHVPLIYILAHRIIWAGVFMLIIVLILNRKDQLLSVMKKPKQMKLLTISSIAISLNWLLNIYAAYTKQVVESSLGQYITPIIVILIGVIIFREKLQLYKIISLIFVISGVVMITVNVGKVPLIAVSLVLSFTLYTYIKKISSVDSIISVTIETLIMMPIMIGYLLFNNVQSGISIFYTTLPKDIFLLMSTGIFTFFPLLLFSYGVKNMNFTNLGFIQYLAPTISLCIGIYVFNEVFSIVHLISFSLIWIAIFIVVFVPILKRR